MSMTGSGAGQMLVIRDDMGAEGAQACLGASVGWGWTGMAAKHGKRGSRRMWVSTLAIGASITGGDTSALQGYASDDRRRHGLHLRRPAALVDGAAAAHGSLLSTAPCSPYMLQAPPCMQQPGTDTASDVQHRICAAQARRCRGSSTWQRVASSALRPDCGPQSPPAPG